MFRRRLGEFPVPAFVGAAQLEHATTKIVPKTTRSRTISSRSAHAVARMSVSPSVPMSGCGCGRRCCAHHRTTRFPVASSSFSTGSGGGSQPSSSYSAEGPSRQLKSWESGARMVRNTTVENKYLEHIREVHDPSQHLKTIEDELKGTIGKALGKQGQKVLLYARLMAEEKERYDALVAAADAADADGTTDAENAAAPSTDPSRCRWRSDPDVRRSAELYNEHREKCLHARWELIVHRQAVGFIVGNHKFVTDKFPVADALPVRSGDGGEETTDHQPTSNNDNKNNKTKKTFSDQLDWWQRIGRWK